MIYQKMKYCNYCGKELNRKKKENNTTWNRRMFCDKHCSGKGRIFSEKELNHLKKLQKLNVGREPWNKGIKIGSPSQETRERMSIANIGNKKRVGKQPWNKGTKGLMVCWSKGLSSLNDSRVLGGENHWNWKGGKSRDKRGTPENRQWISNVFTRDNWMCQTCGERSCKGNPVYLEAHHIKGWAKYPELRFNIDNGVTLCGDCHKLTINYKGKENGNISKDTIPSKDSQTRE